MRPEAGGSRSTAERAPGQRSWLIGLSLLVWWIGGYGLVAYGVVTDRGPFAFLLDAQRAVLGASNMAAGALLGACLIFLGPVWLARLLLRLWPESRFLQGFHGTLRQSMASRAEIAAKGAASWATMDRAARLAALRRRRRGALLTAVTILAATAALATYLRVTTNADAGRPLTPVVLTAGQPIDLHGASPWVHVTGAIPLRGAVVQRDYAIRGVRHRDFYTPLVPRGWHRGERIELLEKDRSFPDDQGPRAAADPSGPIEGRLSAGGPRPDIAALFREHNIPVGDWTAVLTRQRLHGRIPGEAAFLNDTIWIMGGFLTLLALLIAASVQWHLVKLRRSGSPSAGRRDNPRPDGIV